MNRRANTDDDAGEVTIRVAPVEPLLYNTTDAAMMLGIGRTNLYTLLRDGSVRSVTIGTRRLVPRCELEAFVARLLEAA